MKRLCKTLLLGAIVLSSFVGCSKKPQESGTYKVAIVQPVEHPSLNTIRESIIKGLEDNGLKDNIEIIYKNASGDMSLLPSIMDSLVGDKVDMIVPIATKPAQAAAVATTTIPIVFSAISDPVLAGLVTDLTATTGNITGVSDAIPVEEILKLALEITPGIKTFGFIYDSSEPNSVSGIEVARAFCDANGIGYKEATVSNTSDIQLSAQSLVGEVDAYFTPIDNTVASAMDSYIQVANDNNLPVYVSADSMVADGGLATVGIDYTVLGKQTADMIARIYKGEKITDNPIEVINQYSKMVNIKAAKTLGIEIPEHVLSTYVIIGEE